MIKSSYNLIGKQFDRWNVIEFDQEVSEIRGQSSWKCKCMCGTIKTVDQYCLMNGISRSCGCLSRETTSNRLSKTNQIYTFDNYGICFFNNSNEYFIFDLDDIDVIQNRCWHKQSRGYATSNSNDGEILAHRVIMSKYYNINGKEIDHINHNKLDNRKCNLRVCTASENKINRMVKESNTGIRNIHYSDKTDSYMVSIHHNKNIIQKRFKLLNDAINFKNDFYNNHKDINEFVYDPQKDVRNNLLNNNIIKPFIYIQGRKE